MNKKESDETVLVLGGSGLLGYHCVVELTKHYNVIQTYNSNSLTDNNSEYFAWNNTKDLEDLLLRHKPSAIVNTIAYVTVDGCEDNPKMAENLNAKFISHLIKAMTKVGLSNSHLIQISSASVYGNHKNKPIPWKETDETNPMSVYAKTKLEGELNAQKHPGPVSILRTDFYGINPRSEKSLLWKIIDYATNGKTMEGWQNVYFSPVSCWKLSRIISEMIKYQIEGVYNVGCNHECTKHEFAEIIYKSIGIEGKVKKVTLDQGGRVIRPNYTALNSSQLNSVIDADYSLRDDLGFYMKNLPIFPDKTNFFNKDKRN